MIEQSFIEFAAANGLPITHAVTDGKIHRIKTPDDRGRNKSGWYVYKDGLRPYAIVGSWKDGSRYVWRSNQSFEAPQDFAKSAAEQREKAKRREVELKQIQSNAANKAYEIYLKAEIAEKSHEYLKKKRIKAPAGIRQNGSDLIVPVHDINNVIMSLQFIGGDGSKRFLKGGRILGGHFSIGPLTEWIYLCEGVATAISIHERTDSYTIACFHAGNLKPVALALKAKHPNCHFLVCADDDRGKAKNVGILKAKSAARAVGGEVLKPKFCCSECSCTDFNDVANCPEIKGASDAR